MTTLSLRERCRDAGLTLRGLARSIGVHPSCVELWNNGKRPIPAMRVLAVCEALGCTPEDLGCRLGPDLAPGWLQITVPPEPFRYSPVVWFPEQECLMCGTPVDARLRCPRCRRAVA